MGDSLTQQAEALAQQIAHRLNNHWADDTSVPDVVALIQPVLQRVQAETREEDAKMAEIAGTTEEDGWTCGRCRDIVAAAIRARKDRP